MLLFDFTFSVFLYRHLIVHPTGRVACGEHSPLQARTSSRYLVVTPDSSFQLSSNLPFIISSEAFIIALDILLSINLPLACTIAADLLIIAIALINSKGILKGGVVGTYMSNYGLEIFLKKKKIKFFRSKVGDRYVKEKMKKMNFNLGGEQSGHIILGKFATTGDGLLVALEVLFSLRKGKKASKLLNVFKPLPQILANITVKDKNIISKTKSKKAIKKANTVMGNNGKLLVRKSGTEPKIRIMAESYDKSLILKCIKIIKRSIKY